MSKHAGRRGSAEVASIRTTGVFARLTQWMTTNDRNGLVSSPSNIVRRTAAYGRYLLVPIAGTYGRKPRGAPDVSTRNSQLARCLMVAGFIVWGTG